MKTDAANNIEDSATSKTEVEDHVRITEKTKSNEEKQYRINSPSYREVQNAEEEFAKIRSSLPGSSWMSASGSSRMVGMSPLYSRSPSSSPSRSTSPVPSYHPSYLSSAGSSPMSDPDDRYVPVVFFLHFFGLAQSEILNDNLPM